MSPSKDDVLKAVRDFFRSKSSDWDKEKDWVKYSGPSFDRPIEQPVDARDKTAEFLVAQEMTKNTSQESTDVEDAERPAKKLLQKRKAEKALEERDENSVVNCPHCNRVF